MPCRKLFQLPACYVDDIIDIVPRVSSGIQGWRQHASLLDMLPGQHI